MIHTVFWLTGLVTWSLMALAGATWTTFTIGPSRGGRVTADARGAVDTWSLSRRQVRRQACRI